MAGLDTYWKHGRKNVADEWSYKDIPISDYNVWTEPNLITGEIKQITTIAGKVVEEIIQTKSDQIRNALIDLGWTPPDEERPDMYAEQWERFKRDRPDLFEDGSD